MKNLRITSLIAPLILPFLVACAGSPNPNPLAHQAPINHVVLITLENPADAAEMLADNHLLTGISSVRSFWAGTPLDIGRGAPVDGNYTVGLNVGFDDVDGYENYLAAPAHVAYVKKWKPRWKAVRIFDVVTPD